MQLTNAGARLLAGAFVVFAVGVAAGWPVLRMIACIALAAVVTALLLARRRPELEVAREVYPGRVARGEPAVGRLHVRNTGNRAAAAFVAREPVGGEVVTVDVPALDAGRSLTRNYRLPTSRRGIVKVGPLALRREDPLGLVRAERGAGMSTVLWVHPRTHLMVTVASGRSRQYEGPATDQNLRGSLSFHALREYVVGDELRHVHWKTTARTGQLMVREYLDPHQPQLTVVLDTRSSSYSKSGPEGEQPFEEAVEIAASLVRGSADRGYPTRLLTTTGYDVSTGTGVGAAQPLLDRLCEVQVERTGQRGLRQLLPRANTGSCLALVTGRADVALLSEAATMRRQFGVVAVLDLDPTDAPLTSVGVLLVREHSAAVAAAAWNTAVPR